MDGLTLLAEARGQGLEVRAQGDRLIVRGPRSAEALARSLLDHKAEVLAELELEAATAARDAANAEVEPLNARLLALLDAGDRRAAERVQAEIRALLDATWLPAVRRLGRALDRVGRLPPEDRSWVYGDLEPGAVVSGWQRTDDGRWIETPERAAQCVRCPELLAEGDRLFCVRHRVVPGTDGRCAFCRGELDGVSRIMCSDCATPLRGQRRR